MNKHMNSPEGLNINFSSLVAFGISILVIALLTFNVQNQSRGLQENLLPQVENKTQSLQVINLTQETEGYVLLIKNISNKNINGYSLSFDAMYKDSDLTIGERIVTPGEIIKITIPTSLNSLQTITVLAAMFENDTDDGDPKATKRIKDRRVGVKIQLERIRPLLEAILKLPDNELLDALDNFKAKISTLSEDPENGMSDNVRTGLRSAKQDILTDLERLDKFKVRQNLNVIKERQEKHLSRLQKG